MILLFLGLGLLLGFVAGRALTCYQRPDPVTMLRRKARQDIAVRLENGLPVHPDNDYERHLYALSLRRQGKTQQEVAAALVALGLSDVHPAKRASYVNDVVNSVIVGFNRKSPRPAFVEVK